MAATKTNKSFQKRLKLTKRGVVLARPSGQNHFNAKESRVGRLMRKGYQPFTIKGKALSQVLPWGK